MKQHITELQIKELNEEQLLSLIKIMYNANPINFKVEHDIISYNRKGGATNRYYVHGLNLLSRKLTIGKMIEILDNETDDLEIIRDHQRDLEQNIYKCYWIDVIKEEGGCKRSFEEKELCDALWEAVKEIL